MSELKRELLRKSIHFSGLIYIPVYLHFGKEVVVSGIILALLVAFLLEYLRIKHGLFGYLAREYERDKVGAHIYFGFAALLITVLFPMDTCFVAVSTALIGDGIAGIFKRANLEEVATAMMVIAPLAFIATFSLAVIPAALTACIAGAAVERVEKIGRYYVQDNLSVPVVTAVTYEITKYIITWA